MKKTKTITADSAKIEQFIAELDRKEILVFDENESYPIYNQDYSTDCMIINVCLSGSARMHYDLRDVVFSRNDLSIYLPDHIMNISGNTEDFKVTQVFVSRKFEEELKARLGARYLRYQYAEALHMSESQRQDVCNAIRLMSVVAGDNFPNRHEQMGNMLNILLDLIGMFHSDQQTVSRQQKRNEEIFSRFHDLVAEHYRESHQVNYYAQFFRLTPKYFSAIIHQVSGVKATDWISGYVVVQAKNLLLNRMDMNMYDISKYLGFVDQAAFSRFFKHETGQSPLSFRKQLT